MDYRENIVLKPGPGVTINVTESPDGKLIIEAEKIDVKTMGYGDHTHPPIPNGFVYVKGEWDTGFIIKRVSDGSKFIWIPVGALPENGTIDGKNYNEKFGIRKNIKGNGTEYYDESTAEFVKQVESVKKYGGFYISLYKISIDSKGRYVSKKSYSPVVNITFNEALSIASKIVANEEVESHLLNGSEKGSEDEWVKGLRTVIHNVDKNSEWTQEKYGINFRVVRTPYNKEVERESHTHCNPIAKAHYIGFRVALWIK